MRSVLVIIIVIVTKSVSQICNYDNSVELSNRTYNGIKYENGEYFVDNKTGIERGCVCMKETCIRKCCPLGQGYDRKKKKCVDVSDEFDPPIWEGFARQREFHALNRFHFLFFKMNCVKANDEHRLTIGDLTEDFHLKTNGRLYTKEAVDLSSLEYSPDKYCVDNFVTENEDTKNRSIRLNALICYISKHQSNHYAVSASCMLVSCFFIILTVAVYAFLPALRTLYGMVMIMYLSSFFVAFLFMATMQILLLMNNITAVYCTVMTFIIYFSVLAAFFWLNVMCYDLWSKLSIPHEQNICYSNTTMFYIFTNKLEFLGQIQIWLMVLQLPCVFGFLHRYCAYAFGLPTILTILLAALEFSNLPVNNKWLPHLRRKGCFLVGISRLIYLYTPILIAVIANLLLFILTAKRLAQMKKQTQAVLNKKDSQRFSLYIKLFIVTGINWIMEVISSLYPEADNFWLFTDAYNVLVGLIIFIIFVCKKKTLISIRRRFQILMGKPVSRTDTINTTTFSTS